MSLHIHLNSAETCEKKHVEEMTAPPLTRLPPTIDTTAKLHLEAEYFCQKLFGRIVPKDVAERYAKAWNHCFPDADPSFQAKIDLIVAHQLDVEAIEVALRYRRPDNLLTKKIKILFYLLEVRAEFLPYFVNFEHHVVRAMALLIWSLVYGPLKILKGCLLVWRHELL